MKLEAYTDLVKSNMDVLIANVTMAMETLEDENVTLKDRVFMVEKENMRLQTENRMMKEECNRLKGEVIKLLDTIGKMKDSGWRTMDDLRDDVEFEPGNSGCAGCEWNNYDVCNPEFEDKECPDCGCCREHIKQMESGTNETH